MEQTDVLIGIYNPVLLPKKDVIMFTKKLCIYKDVQINRSWKPDSLNRDNLK